MRRKIFDEQVAQMTTLYQSGVALVDIGKQYGISEANVVYWLTKNGAYIPTKGSAHSEPQRRVKAKCRNCKYGDHRGFCNYLVQTGKRRGCLPTECDKYVKCKGKTKSNDVCFADLPTKVFEETSVHIDTLGNLYGSKLC